MTSLPAPSPVNHRHGRVGLTRVTLAVWFIRALVIAASVASVIMATRGGVLDPKYSSGYGLFAWDSHHYHRIMVDGYPANRIEPIIAFFPGYPLLARIAAPFFSPVLGLLVVANVCSLLGLFLMYRWVRALAGEPAAGLATLLAASFPPAMFLAAAYVQGPMFLTVVVALMMMQRSRWLGAGVASGFATALHPTGVAVAITLGLAMLIRRVRWTTMLPVMIVSISGLLAYQGFLWARYDRFDAYLQAQAAWSVEQNEAPPAPSDAKPGDVASTSSTTTMTTMTTWADSLPSPMDKLFSLGAWNKIWLLLILGLTLIGLIRPGPIPRELFALPIVIFLLGYLPGNGARVTSIARLETVAIPCFVVAAVLIHRWKRLAIIGVIAMTLMQAWYAFVFSRGEWAG